jgi:dTMP kinase
VGRLIVIEGLDGAGKRTLADGLHAALDDRGVTMTRIAFPRYGRSAAADLVRDGLYGRVGDLSDSVYGMAVLYALDRHGAVGELAAALHAHDVVLLDRYVASNAAYGAARLHQDADGEFVAWVGRLEIDRLGLPPPDVQVLLRVPPEIAAQRSRGRERADVERARDTFEADAELQVRCAEVYEQLARKRWLSRWHVVDGVADIDHATLAAGLLRPAPSRDDVEFPR